MSDRSKSPVTTRSIVLEGGMTTLSLEDTVWRDLEAIAKEHDLTVAELVSFVEDRLGTERDLSSALRTYVSVNRVLH